MLIAGCTVGDDRVVSRSKEIVSSGGSGAREMLKRERERGNE